MGDKDDRNKTNKDNKNKNKDKDKDKNKDKIENKNKNKNDKNKNKKKNDNNHKNSNRNKNKNESNNNKNNNRNKNKNLPAVVHFVSVDHWPIFDGESGETTSWLCETFRELYPSHSWVVEPEFSFNYLPSLPYYYHSHSH